MILDLYNSIRPQLMRVAVAYATLGGVRDLTQRLQELDGWKGIRKRWLIGFDYCRSDPLALRHLMDVQQSEVRAFDGPYVAKSKLCVPRVSYHPKLFIFSRGEKTGIVAGSGNLSHTGLSKGIEAGVSVDQSTRTNITPLTRWFGSQWTKATRLQDEGVLDLYSRQYESVANRTNPVHIDDDFIPELASSRRQIDTLRLRKLRVCKCLWIEAGNLHQNLGKHRPGNQLMLSRSSRVFFGFAWADLQIDTLIGRVDIEWEGQTRRDCSMRFSNNSMEVLTLPAPVTEGPDGYDQRTLLFERIGVRKFRLSLDSGKRQSHWIKQSKKIGADFRMKSGRRWGVF